MQKPRHHGGASSYSTKLNATQQLLVLLAALLPALLAALLAWLILLLLAALLAAALLATLLSALLSALLLLARFILLILILIHLSSSPGVKRPDERSSINAAGFVFVPSGSRRREPRLRSRVGWPQRRG
jgi:hypothetical protein